MTLDEIKEKLKDRNLLVVAERIGVHFNTLYNIVNDKGNPSYSTLIKLENYLKG